ncbi:hypothetical protein [Pseudomonas frederiksbergensis]|uniref:hypothetical protein n=1 Tax=Pseudomonas frederiksbergensis TaxID=104087 RepID=UPI003D20334C
MQAVIYAGLRNGARDQQIHDALVYKYVIGSQGVSVGTQHHPGGGKANFKFRRVRAEPSGG